MRRAVKESTQQTCCSQVFAEALKTWREKQRLQSPTGGCCKNDVLNDGEVAILQTFVEATKAFITRFFNAYFTPPTRTRRNCFVLSVSAVWTEVATSQDSFVLSRNAVWTDFRLFSTQFQICNCSVSNILRITENCLVFSPIQFTLLTRIRQDSLVLSVSAVWTKQ